MTPKTVLITGASSGIGKAAARYFAAQGWNVAATMRSPHKETELNQLPQVKLFALDVTDPASIAQAIADARKAFGRIDALVNNAGYGADGIFEAMSDEVIRNQFDTNVFGLMRVTRAIIPVMREQGGGVILQVSSMGGRLAFPLFSIYHGTKWAVEGFSEALHYELSPFGIRVKLIEPGAIRTEFMGRSRVEVKPEQLPQYQAFVDQCNRVSEGTSQTGDSPEVVAKTIFRAAADGSRRMRYATGSPAPLLLWLRKRIPDSWWFAIVRGTYKI
ncbi:MAG: SDR family oxidoreductase [Bacteroidia bacterium]|nr:SDR family oxidoreductase [Bacteroidia bacterium]